MAGRERGLIVGQSLWFASRAAGVVVLVLLTATLVVGALHAGRASAAGWPRFAVSDVHRNLSLLAASFLAVHVASAVADGYAGIRWLEVLVPFVSDYHPFWLGLGAVALDLLLAALVTSLLRARIPRRAWRLVHLVSYPMWPVALLHGIGIGGADSGLGWMIALDVGCVLAVVGAVAARVSARHPDTERRRSAVSP
jgi:methionine sulfoxide reductase heme-binding subunit